VNSENYSIDITLHTSPAHYVLSAGSS